jgi:hypothetical protein
MDKKGHRGRMSKETGRKHGGARGDENKEQEGKMNRLRGQKRRK